MKKIVTVVSALVLGITAMAQTDQGGWMFGAGSNLGFTSGKADNDLEDATSNLMFSARAGYFVIDNLAVGLDIGYNSQKTGDADAATGMLVGPYARYFLMENKLFGQLSYQFGSDKGYYGMGNSDNAVALGDLGIQAGYAAWLNDNVTLEPSVGYHMTSAKADGADEAAKGSYFGVFVNFGIYLGN